jgi:predicted amidohydrolase YtcJ
MTFVWRLLLLLALLCVAQARAESALVLHGGAVYTVDPARPWASAVVVRDGRIAFVGDDAGAMAAAGSDARVIALNERMVLPGFQDSHIHLMGGGLRLIRCQLKGLATAEAIYAAVRACAASDKSAWLRGAGWEPEAFGAQGPTRAKLDEIVGDRPALLTTEDGFAAWVNSRAMAAGGVTDSDGVVTGDAYERIRAKAPKASPAQYREALMAASAMANRFGITSAVDAGASEEAIDAYHAADVANALSLRLVAAQVIDPDKAPARIDEMVARRDAVKGRRFRADAAKIFLDGEFDRRTAAIEENYVGEPLSAGSLYVDPFRTFDTVDVLHEHDFLVHMHAMGDRAVFAALNAAGHARVYNAAQFGLKGRRHQVAHVGLVEPKLMSWFSKYEISANFQPSFFHAGDPATVRGAALLGSKRAARMYPIKSVADAGARILISSDWPALAVNPLEIIQYALTRQPLDGSKPPLQPDQRITLAQALAAYTINPAWASRSDADTGSIVVGKRADLVVLDRNLFETPVGEIHKARVLLTLLDGAPVYRDPDFAWR